MKNTSADEVLICLNEFYEKNHLERHKHDDIRQALAVKYGCPPSDLVMILEYLWRTGMIDKDDNDKYIIKYEGKVFIGDGGYTQQANNRLIQRRKDIVYTAAVGVGTALAGVYALFEMVKFFFQKKHLCLTIEYSFAFYLFESGILTGIAILLIAKEVLNQKNRG